MSYNISLHLLCFEHKRHSLILDTFGKNWINQIPLGKVDLSRINLCANKEDFLHATHCIISLITFSLNTCYLIRLHVDMLTLFDKLLTKEQMLIQKVRMERCLCI